MKTQDYSSRVAYRPPARWYAHLNNTLGVLLTRIGAAPRDAVVLEVPGRRSGRPRRTPLLLTRLGGRDHLVALAGESEWVRNVRAAGGLAVIHRRGTRRVRLVEVPADERPPIILGYLRLAGQRSGVTSAEQQARSYFGTSLEPTRDELRAAAAYYPVFRVDPCPSQRESGRSDDPPAAPAVPL